MLPWVYDFRWEPMHLVFLGVFFSVVTLLLSWIAVSVARTVVLLREGRVEGLRWSQDFSELPTDCRVCRHVITRETRDRTCPNAFDCRVCNEHQNFVNAAAQRQKAADADASTAEVAGLSVPTDRSYHRGHTWVREEPDGTVTVGPDALASRLIGSPDEVDLPERGEQVCVNGTAWRVRKNGAEVRVLSPVDGEVVDVGSGAQEWYLRIKPREWPFDARHLLKGSEVKPWILREIDRLQLVLSTGEDGPRLADGGVLVEDLSGALPEERRDAILGEMLLDP